MEFEKLQKSPDVVFEETLDNLSESFASLTTSTRTFSASLKELYDEKNSSEITHQKINAEFTKLKEETKPDLIAYHHDTITECDSLADNIQNLFEHYKVSYEEWCLHESSLQKKTEDYKNNIDGIVYIHEEILSKTRRRVEKLHKNISDDNHKQTTVSAEAEAKEDKLPSNRNQSTCQNYSIACVFLFIPRQIHRCFGYICCSRTCCTSPPRRSGSHETLVVRRKKDSVAEKAAVKEFNSSQEKIQEITKTLISSLENVISSMRETANGISYIYQDLCRLDYHEANKERHYEIMAGKYDPIMRNCRSYVSSLVSLRSGIAGSLALNRSVQGEDEG